MKKLFFLCGLMLTAFCNCANTPQTETRLDPKQFSQKIKEVPNAPVVDVRTPDEFNGGHLPHALNIDWNGNIFINEISKLDKEKPVFVYCHSGRRSGEAAEKMRNEGFKEVYELKGGIAAWEENKLPEEK